jgi:hypothetical protein
MPLAAFIACSVWRIDNLPMKKTALFALTLLALPLLAQDNPAKKIDLGKLPSQSKEVDNVIVPVPSEIFSVLDKLGKPPWVATQRPLKDVAKPDGQQAQQAFYLGTVIAEGFIAVEAQDKEQVKIIGRSVISLAKSLGVREAVVKRAQAIITAADNSEWMTVRRELDGALNEVKQALVEIKSPDLADLISLGGWLRGTEALCDVVGKSYSADGADLLHQPALIVHFDGKLNGLKARIKGHPLIGKSLAALKSISPLMGPESGGNITEKTVKEIGNIVRDLVKEIQTPSK